MKPIYSLLIAALATAAMASASAADALYVDSKTVQQVQKKLTDRGFRTGGVDGRMGPQTQAALVNFQKAEKLQPTGQLNRQTLVALGVQKTDGTAAPAQKYDRATIRKAQETLNARGFKAGSPNGILGQSTSSALRSFQKQEGIVVTGRLNPRTLSHLGITEDSASTGTSRSADAKATPRR